MGIVFLSFRPQKASSNGQQMTFVEIWGDEGLEKDTEGDVKHSNTKHTFSLLLLSGNKNNSRKKQKSGKTSENHVVLVDDICCERVSLTTVEGGMLFCSTLCNIASRVKVSVSDWTILGVEWGE